jgi:TolA-binding protein
MNRTIAIAALAFFCAVAAEAVPGILTKAGTGQEIQGDILWQAGQGVYVVTLRDSPVQIKVTPREVQNIRVKPPADIEAAVQKVQQGDFTPAIPVLSKILEEYAMLEWDVQAARWLAEAYLKSKDPKKAADVCDKVIASNPKAVYSTDMAPLYLQALVETEQFPKLRKALDECIALGNRELSAVALVRRGDMERKQSKLKEALVDGYLRVVVLYQDAKELQPEALYKAIKCFEELGQTAHADKMRKRLLAEYPGDPYAEKIKAGT